ncbi:ATP-binding response regulator [Salidesulfovibrio onnuriiensis]|uniref:ATP-binding response regulator n=1 Tax=Salidesulfovibrio onnuriiensis TaxID=2583823 RepID=UPI0016503F4F|nr:hybrid sensor histidine kinase/response regulator [Salidesulfovibrio onnuriiensis]
MVEERPLIDEPSDDDLLFADEESADREETGLSAWKLMIVDDQEDVHNMTRLVLGDFTFEGRGLEFLSAYSGREAKKLISEHPDTAVMLLDVVMEDNQAGLDVAKFIRAEACNRLTRIILRTGQPGQAPERKVVTELDINDYKQKTELTAQKLFTAVTTAIRSFRDLLLIEEGRKSMHLLALSVAHQVRNRTVAIAGFANLLLKKTQENGSIKEYIRTILDESERLEDMVGAVNSYAAIREPQLTTVELAEAVDQACDRADVHAQLLGKKVSWARNLNQQNVDADPELLSRLLDALLNNAVDFTDESPVRISVSVRGGEEGCRVAVEDHGIGISETDLPHIFDPFFSQKPHGAGMGLAIARKVADEHQWDIVVKSRAGHGSTFDVFIPNRLPVRRPSEEPRID